MLHAMAAQIFNMSAQKWLCVDICPYTLKFLFRALVISNRVIKGLTRRLTHISDSSLVVLSSPFIAGNPTYILYRQVWKKSIQWNLSIVDTFGTAKNVLISEVLSFQR